jgi:hypothetical protein
MPRHLQYESLKAARPVYAFPNNERINGMHSSNPILPLAFDLC